MTSFIQSIAEKLNIVSPSGPKWQTPLLSKVDQNLTKMEPHGPIYECLLKTKIRDIIPKDQDLVIAFEELNACNIINYIAPHHINNVPICDSTGKLKSVLTMLDFMSWIADFDDNKSIPPGERWLKRDEIMKERTLGGMRLRQGTIRDVLSYANPPDPHILSLDDYASEAAKLFATGVKFVLILDHSKNPQNIVTQHDLATFIHNCLLTNPAGKAVGSWSLRGLGLPERNEVRAISMNTPIREAIKVLKNNGGAVALVDQLGVIRGNFSPADVKGLLVENAPSFQQTVIRFLRSRSHSSLQPIQCLITCDYLCAAEKFRNFDVHRCYSYTDHINLAIHGSFENITETPSTTQGEAFTTFNPLSMKQETDTETETGKRSDQQRVPLQSTEYQQPHDQQKWDAQKQAKSPQMKQQQVPQKDFQSSQVPAKQLVFPTKMNSQQQLSEQQSSFAYSPQQAPQRDVGSQKSPECLQKIIDAERSRAQQSGLSPSMQPRASEFQPQKLCTTEESVAQDQRDKWNKIMGTAPVQSPGVLGLREQQERLEASQRATDTAWNTGQVNYPSTAPSQYQKMPQSPDQGSNKSKEYAA